MSIDRVALHAEWRERAQAVALDFTPRAAPSLLRNDSHEAEQATQAVRYATAHLLMERSAVVPLRDIESSALERGVGHTQHHIN